MGNIAFLIQKGNMGFNEVINLPYAVFLSLLKHFQMFELMKNPEYQKALEKQKYLNIKEPDWGRIRPLTKGGA